MASLVVALARAQNAAPVPSANEIADRVERMNEQRALTQPGYVCERIYTLDYEGFPESKHAEMRVRAQQDGARKELTIMSETGSSPLRLRVLHKIVNTEREATKGTLHEGSRLTRKNYDFAMVGTESSQRGAVYVLDVKPRVESMVAWVGRIWVDGTDYAVTRAEGHPAKMPSWWTTHSDFIATYQRLNGIWLPERNVSDTQVRFGGHAHLVIDYKDCHSSGALQSSDLHQASVGAP
ncbi:LolA-like protein [Edaphobacter bradus]|uniref:hypothetical protein n=1 Tax=Edaphobacter bradus TaxID=2259016 RepID=UPI0021DFFA5E|nr:hypothetical protein [Edaphobacter bradus]